MQCQSFFTTCHRSWKGVADDVVKQFTTTITHLCKFTGFSRPNKPMPRNSFWPTKCRRPNFVEVTPGTCTIAGILAKMPERFKYRCMLKQQNIYRKDTYWKLCRNCGQHLNYAQLLRQNYGQWRRLEKWITISQNPANQNCRRGFENARKLEKAPFTIQSLFFPKRQE